MLESIQRLYPQTLLARLILVTTLLIGSISLLDLVADVFRDRDVRTEGIQCQLQAIAGTLALQIDGNTLATAESDRAVPNALTDWALGDINSG